jgi:hypothetical protein
MADRVSSRRALANSFFLTLNVAIIGVLGTVASGHSNGWGGALSAMGLAILLGQCFVWFYMLRSYQMLSKAKYSVIAVMEERLPARIYSHGEWNAMRSGKYGRYIRLTDGTPVIGPRDLAPAQEATVTRVEAD